MSKKEYKTCSNCVMDTTDELIEFDENGMCDHCNTFYDVIKPEWNSEEYSLDNLKKISKKIRDNSKGEYDCIIGFSGGTDSSYLIYVVKEIMNLNPLIYTVDTGWNLNVAIENIEKIVNYYDLDLYTEVIDWDIMKDLQLSFFKAQVPYQDRPQDHVIFAGLYNFAVKNKIKYVLTGGNKSTECIRPPVQWVNFNDLKLIKDIYKKYGKNRGLKKIPTCSIFKYKLYYQYIKGMKRLNPLDYIEYNKEKAEKILEEKFNWKKYKNKHYENIFTRFYEGYYLVEKFGYDKRKVYYSNLILTEQMTRDKALDLLKNNPYDKKTMLEDKEYIASKLGISIDEFDSFINGENKSYEDYKNSFSLIQTSINIARKLGVEKRNFR